MKPLDKARMLRNIILPKIELYNPQYSPNKEKKWLFIFCYYHLEMASESPMIIEGLNLLTFIDLNEYLEDEDGIA